MKAIKTAPGWGWVCRVEREQWLGTMEPKPRKTIIISQNKYPAINYSCQQSGPRDRQKTIVSQRAGWGGGRGVRRRVFNASPGPAVIKTDGRKIHRG